MPTAAEHRDGRAELRPQPVQYCARTGLDAAAHRADERQINVVIRNLDRSGFVDDRVCGKGRLAEERGHRRPVRQRQARGAVRLDAAKVDLIEMDAGVRMRRAAVAAGAAVAERNADLVAHLELRHLRADGLHDAAALMAQHRGQRNGDKLLLHGFIRVADAAGDDFDENFMLLRRSKLHLFDDKRCTLLMGNSCFDLHNIPPVSFCLAQISSAMEYPIPTASTTRPVWMQSPTWNTRGAVL